MCPRTRIAHRRRTAAEYQCVETSLEGFIQQLACASMRHGYVHFVRGAVPAEKDPRVVDRKLIARYGVARSKWDRARRKRAGWANVQYLRFGRVFVLVATAGEHEFFRREKGSVRDARRTPIRVGGYAVSVRQGHVHVRIDLAEYRVLRAWFWDVAVRRSVGSLARAFYELPFEPYAPVRRQLLNVLRLVNKRRKVAGLEVLPSSVRHLRRRSVRPFKTTRADSPSAEEAA